MEFEKKHMASSYWIALSNVESRLAPHADDPPEIASMRAAMNRDHFRNRVTLNQSVSDPLHVMQHLTDHR